MILLNRILTIDELIKFIIEMIMNKLKIHLNKIPKLLLKFI